MKACQHCINPAFVRCRTHKQAICGSEYCTGRHRIGRGDCEFVEAGLHGWRLEVIRWTVAIGVGCLITLLVAL